MKKLVLILLAVTIYMVPMAKAEIGVGYELLGVFPHAVTLTGYDKASGYGFKASSDFGASTLSTVTSIFVNLFSFGNINNMSFYTLSLTKDFMQSEAHRAYMKLGVFGITAKGTGNLSETKYLPVLGVGGEWKGFMGNNNISTALEAGFPEILLVGLRYYF